MWQSFSSAALWRTIPYRIRKPNTKTQQGTMKKATISKEDTARITRLCWRLILLTCFTTTLIYWLAGGDFTRGRGLAVLVVVSLVLSGMAWVVGALAAIWSITEKRCR